MLHLGFVSCGQNEHNGEQHETHGRHVGILGTGHRYQERVRAERAERHNGPQAWMDWHENSIAESQDGGGEDNDALGLSMKSCPRGASATSRCVCTRVCVCVRLGEAAPELASSEARTRLSFATVSIGDVVVGSTGPADLDVSGRLLSESPLVKLGKHMPRFRPASGRLRTNLRELNRSWTCPSWRGLRHCLVNSGPR